MNVLVDTSVWIDHFHQADPRLASLLEEGAVVVHPWVLGELACGSLRRREETLADLAMLEAAPEIPSPECLHFLAKRKLHGKGLSWIDVQLLASCLIAGCSLWTRDKNLRHASSQLGIDCT